MTTATIEKTNIVIDEILKVNSSWDNKAKRKEYCKTQALERLGQTNHNKHLSKMWIINYTSSTNVTVQFEDGYIANNTTYQQFCNGSVKNPNDKTIFGHGFIGIGKFKPSVDGKVTNSYTVWQAMLQRCYSADFKQDNHTYEDCKCCSEWHNYQIFAEWYNENYYNAGEALQLDKDILIKGNKLYSSKTCILVPKSVNVLFTKSDRKRGDTPIGVSPQKSGKYTARCQIGTQQKEYLGLFVDPVKAFEAYKEFKEQYIKEIAESYRDRIPQILYKAMMEYKVEVTD